MKKRFIFTLLLAASLSSAAFAAAPTPAPASFGIVNFATCLSESKYGKKEQTSFEAMKKQMSTLLQDTEKQLNEINSKFADPEYLDGLSPEAEAELKAKFQALSEELNRYQSQYYQVINQANMRIYQVMSGNINSASEAVANDKKLSMVVSKEACFFYTPQLDITNLIIAELDKRFDDETKKNETASKEIQEAGAVKK